MFLQQQASPVVHTVGGSGGGGGRGEGEEKGGRGREKGRGRGGGGGGGEEWNQPYMTQKTSGPGSSPPFQLHIMCPKPLRKEACNKTGTHAREWLAT